MDFFSAAVARSIEKPLALFFEVYNKRVCLLLYVTYICTYMYQIRATFFIPLTTALHLVYT